MVTLFGLPWHTPAMPPDVTCHEWPFQLNVAALPARGAPASTTAIANSRPRPTAFVPPMLAIPLVGGRRSVFFRENRRAVSSRIDVRILSHVGEGGQRGGRRVDAPIRLLVDVEPHARI